MSQQKTGTELAEQRVKRKQRERRREVERLKVAQKEYEKAKVDATLIGELKAAQSNNRTEKLRDKVYEAIALGRTETIENQPNARSALRLEALLPDPIQERKVFKKQKHEMNTIVNREEQFRVNRIMTDDDWGVRRL